MYMNIQEYTNNKLQLQMQAAWQVLSYTLYHNAICYVQ